MTRRQMEKIIKYRNITAEKAFEIHPIFLDLCSDEFKINILKNNPNHIRYISNPSYEMQLTAVSVIGMDNDSLCYIKEPTDEIKLEAIKHNPDAIAYIRKPTEEMQLAAVRLDGNVLCWIKNPSHQVKLEAVRECSEAIESIIFPNEELQLEALKSYSYISCIVNPTKKVQLEALKKSIHEEPYFTKEKAMAYCLSKIKCPCKEAIDYYLDNQ